ncbi:Dipeptide and tripeptide permease A [Pseudobythopirellula maris]|uniref:Dipeptide and tripeptide permease A n=1 Tax=Pseudobythopirellula maris TaxID=2527991 RepID=A0A5C5ZSV9_9BACT|nr:POT family MFS transporter [Pseudobythopirellula maris]TWT90155.1 Dipeptide and tripeptide permease A [Pseudobythopirellula maris]
MSDTASQSPYRTAPDPERTTMPPGIPYIVGNEAAERFSFYGMKAILTVFVTKHLMDSSGALAPMTAEEAKALLGWFVAAVYITPFIGALIADRWWGKYPTILWLSLFYCAGHGVLAFVDVPINGVEPRWVLYAGLGLIALGAGGIKPCVTSHVGDQFGRANAPLIERVYGWFYFSINFGAFFSMLLTPILLDRLGTAWAFGVPGVLMAVATFVFWLGRNRFVHVPPAGPSYWRETFGDDGLRAMLNLTPLLLFVAMFWSLFDQTASAWVLQAEKMDRVLFGSVEPSAAQFQAVNSMFVLTLIPLLTYVVYPFAGRFVLLTPLRKIGAGMFVAAGAFAIAGYAETLIQAGETPTIYWQVLAYFVLTVSELLISITMLEFFYTQAPRKMKSIIMAFCMLSISVGNAFTALVNIFIVREDGSVMLPGASYYWFFTVGMLITACAYVVWSQFYRGRTYLQGDEVEELAVAKP